MPVILSTGNISESSNDSTSGVVITPDIVKSCLNNGAGFILAMYKYTSPRE